MALNLNKFKEDLDRLILEGDDLEKSLFFLAFDKIQAIKYFNIKEDQKNEFFSKLPPFSVNYEAWYSEALAVIKQILPDRLQDFRDHFEIPKGRKELDHLSYRISDALKGLTVTRGAKTVLDFKVALPHLRQQVSILRAAERRFRSSLFEIKQLVQADLFDSEIDSARELLRKKFLRGAGAIAGVVLEKHLRQTCENHNVKITKRHPTLSDLNELLKANSIIDFTQWRHITLLADYRNLCDHNKQKEPTADQVNKLIDGTDEILKTVS